MATTMHPHLRYAATYLRFRHPAYLRRSLLAYPLPAARPSPLQRSYRANGCRVAFVLNALIPDTPAPPVGLLLPLPTGLSF